MGTGGRGEEKHGCSLTGGHGGFETGVPLNRNCGRGQHQDLDNGEKVKGHTSYSSLAMVA